MNIVFIIQIYYIQYDNTPNIEDIFILCVVFVLYTPPSPIYLGMTTF